MKVDIGITLPTAGRPPQLPKGVCECNLVHDRIFGVGDGRRGGNSVLCNQGHWLGLVTVCNGGRNGGNVLDTVDSLIQ